jgi:hypothetical protein
LGIGVLDDVSIEAFEVTRFEEEHINLSALVHAHAFSFQLG